jgi:hypothetical protein
MAEIKLDVEKLVNDTFGKHFGVTFARLRELAEADEDELFREYLRREMDDCMDFHEYVNRMIDLGVEIEQGKSKA